MYAYNRFFRGLRLMLAMPRRFDAVSPSRVGLGAVALHNVEHVIIPKIEESVMDADNEGDRENAMHELAVWSKYAEDNTPQGKSWNVEAIKVAVSVARKFGMTNDDEVTDFANTIASELFVKSEKLFDRFDIKDGPMDLIKLFKKAVSDTGLDIMRKKLRSYHREVSLQTPGSEGEGELQDFIEDPRGSDLGREELQNVWEMMSDYVLGGLHNETAKRIFRMWAEIAERRGGADRVSLRQDVFPSIMETSEKKLGEKSMMEYWWKLIKPAIRDWIKAPASQGGLALNPTTQVMKKLKLANSIADNFWKARFATWMLAPYYGAQKIIRGARRAVV